MCHHCENAVKTALEALDFIDSAEADHEAGKAVVALSGGIDEDAVRKAIEDEDYVFKGIVMKD